MTLAPQPQTQQPGVAPAASGQRTLQLKKGQLLFAEGENSKSMYFLRKGMIRIYKKKGDSSIEIATIRPGELLGELAFLDGNPRSAAAEALNDCELVEISGPTFVQTLAKTPDWLKLLLKTVVGRLRSSSTKIRQLEQASTSFDYSDKDGKRTSKYVYLSTTDVLKVCSAVMLVASRYGKSADAAPTDASGGLPVRVGLLQRYANQIMGIPVAKITSMLDLLAQVGIMSLGSDTGSEEVSVKDIDFLEKFIAYLNEENLLEPSKRHDMSLKGFLIMGLISKHLDEFKADPTTGLKAVNVASINKAEAGARKEAFRLDDFVELVKLGYATQLNIKSTAETFTTIKPDEFLHTFRLQRTIKAIEAVNEQKSVR